MIKHERDPDDYSTPYPKSLQLVKRECEQSQARANEKRKLGPKTKVDFYVFLVCVLIAAVAVFIVRFG